MGYVGKVKDTAGNTHLVGSTLYGTCDTAAATAAKVVTCANFSELVEGVTVHVKFTYSNTAANATLNVNNTGAKPLCRFGTSRVGKTSKSSWTAGGVVSFTYDGTSWVMNDFIEDTVGSDIYVNQQQLPSNEYSNAHPLLLKYTGAPTSETNPVYFMDEIYIAGGQTLIVPYISSYSLGAAAGYGVDSSIGATPGSNLPTSSAVANYVASALADTANFQGTLVQTDSGNSGTKWTQAEIEAASYKKGWYWVCETAGTYCGKVLEAGDMLFCVATKDSTYSASDFTAIQNNIETLTTTEVSTLWTNAVAVA